jgi:ParB family transcriptional regulator, chromosome partitioning protein
MVARKAPNITSYFSGAQQAQQLSAAETEIQSLRTEIDRLRASGVTELEAQLTELRSQLQSQSGIIAVPIDRIYPNPEQPRRTFLAESIESMSRSLATDGQLEPIILVQREQLVLFDGERRWRSAKALGWETLQAVIVPEPTDLHRKALLTSLHREDLNPLDKAEAIVREISSTANLDSSTIPRILSTTIRRLNNQGRMGQISELAATTQQQSEQLAALGLDEREKAILELLLELQLNPASVDANIFPMLSLPADLKTAIREAGLKGVHALALQKLSAKNLGVSEAKAKTLRVKTTAQVLNEKLSAAQTRKLVGEVLAAQATAFPAEPKKARQVSTATRALQKLVPELLADLDSEQLLQLQSVLLQKLAEIEGVLPRK